MYFFLSEENEWEFSIQKCWSLVQFRNKAIEFVYHALARNALLLICSFLVLFLC